MRYRCVHCCEAVFKIEQTGFARRVLKSTFVSVPFGLSVGTINLVAYARQRLAG
jgi:hypothetical protein